MTDNQSRYHTVIRRLCQEINGIIYLGYGRYENRLPNKFRIEQELNELEYTLIQMEYDSITL